jgi:hypothetical protein
MSTLLDHVARILGTPMPRRHALRLVGGALAAAIVGLGAQSASAFRRQDDKGDRHDNDRDKRTCPKGTTSCGNGVANSVCCPANTCCAKHGNQAACCRRGQCVCEDGTCASSTRGACPRECPVCGEKERDGQDGDELGAPKPTD